MDDRGEYRDRGFCCGVVKLGPLRFELGSNYRYADLSMALVEVSVKAFKRVVVCLTWQ